MSNISSLTVAIISNERVILNTDINDNKCCSIYLSPVMMIQREFMWAFYLSFCIMKIWMKDCTQQNVTKIKEVKNLSSQGCLFKKHLK